MTNAGTARSGLPQPNKENSNEILMFFRTTKKTAQDVSMTEPIDTDRDGNALTLMDTMVPEDNMVKNIDNKN